MLRNSLLLSLLLVTSPVWAAPAIVTTQGLITNDSVVTITGSGFGTKGSAAPLVWHNFANGAAPSGLAANSISVFNNTDNPRTIASAYTTRFDHKLGGSDFFSYNTTAYPQWYVAYWIRLASNWHWGTTTSGGADDGLANIKFFRAFPTGARSYTNFGYTFHGWGSRETQRFFETPASGNVYLTLLSTWLTLNTWHLMEWEYGENSAVDVADGSTKLWVDGNLKDSSTTIITNYGVDGTAVNKRPYIIGIYDSWPPSDAAVANMYAYIAEVYVDNSWSRVALCDVSVWANCTHREIQRPSAWSDSSITITANTGTFINDTVYLYVVDSAGVVNATGFAVQLGPPASSRKPVTRTPATRTPVTRTPVAR